MSWYFPVLDYVITWLFGDWNNDHTYQHKGVDFGVPVGTGVAAVTDMTITETGNDELGYGNYIKGVTEDGLTVIFGHLKDNGIDVDVGDFVNGGDNIGYSGNTGNSSGPHLHLEVRNTSGTPIDPMPYLEGAGEPEPVEPMPGDGVSPPGDSKTTPVSQVKSIGEAVKTLADFAKWIKALPYKRIGGNITVILGGIVLVGLAIYMIAQTQAAQALGSAVGSAIGSAVSEGKTETEET